MPALDILLVDDQQAVREAVASALTGAGHRVTEHEDGAAALDAIQRRTFDVAVLDIRLPNVDGLTLFKRVRAQSPGTAVVLMTAFESVPDAVDAIRAGAHDYVTKPFDPIAFVANVIGPIRERRALRLHLAEAGAHLEGKSASSDVLGSSACADELRRDIDSAAENDAPVLVRGEHATGKRFVARLIHERSARRAGPCVWVSCASLSPAGTLPAFLGRPGPVHPLDAATLGEGLLAAARGGTLVVSDIGSLSREGQAIVAAVSRDAAIPPSRRTRAALDVRVIATIVEGLAQGASPWLPEWSQTVHRHEIRLRPLRERMGDLPVFFEYFLRRESRGVAPRISPSAWDAICSHPFPDNLDGLQGAVRHALAHARGGPIERKHLPAAIQKATRLPGVAILPPPKRTR